MKKSYRILKFEFICIALILSVDKKFGKEKELYSNELIVKDVLFVNGYDYKKYHNSFYFRVLNQIEQLNVGFLESDLISCESLDFSIVRFYRVIIISHCLWTSKIVKSIELAKSLNKKVLLDIDELNRDENEKLIKDDTHTLEKIDNNIIEIKQIKHYNKNIDAIITSNEEIEKKLKIFFSTIFINHNVINEEILKITEKALINKNNKNNKNEDIIIGIIIDKYIKIENLEIIKTPLLKILSDYKNIKLLIIGEYKIPKFLNNFSQQIKITKTNNIKKFFSKIATFDISIIPLKKNFNNKFVNENKWFESALLKIPTIISNYGAFKNIINNNKTGFLCSNTDEWYTSLKTLIINKNLRNLIGENSYNFCIKEYNTLNTGRKLSEYISLIANKHIGFFLPKFQLSGGIYVILKHASILKEYGWNVDLIIPESNYELLEFQNHKFNVINSQNTKINAIYDIIVATLYSTLYEILNIYKSNKYIYLVQSYETNFYPPGNNLRIKAEKSYTIPMNIKYITISKWCKNWLYKTYKKKSIYAPNGIDLDNYKQHKRNLNKEKIRILIEGDNLAYYKNVDESFKIAEKLDKNKFEIWYLSSKGNPKDWYVVNKLLKEIPYEKVHEVYEQCDILIKSSWLESFSYPPLEMMATGGYSIVVQNEGNKEYLRNGENCLVYNLGNIDEAIKLIYNLISDEKLQQYLYQNGLNTAKKRDWKILKKQIISLYEK